VFSAVVLAKHTYFGEEVRPVSLERASVGCNPAKVDADRRVF
jgi:hypothetical protein